MIGQAEAASTWVQPGVRTAFEAVAKEHDRSIAAELRHLVRQHLERERRVAV